MRTVCHNFVSSARNGMRYVHTQRVSFPPHWAGLDPSLPSHPALFLSESLILLSDSCLAPVGTALYFSLHPLAKVIDPEDQWSNHNMWNFTKVARLANQSYDPSRTLSHDLPTGLWKSKWNPALSTILNKNDTKTSRKQQRKGGSGTDHMRTTGSTDW